MFGPWDRFNFRSRLAQEARRGQPDLCEVGRGHETLLRSVPIAPHAWAACLPLYSPRLPRRTAPMLVLWQKWAWRCRLSSTRGAGAGGAAGGNKRTVQPTRALRADIGCLSCDGWVGGCPGGDCIGGCPGGAGNCPGGAGSCPGGAACGGGVAEPRRRQGLRQGR